MYHLVFVSLQNLSKSLIFQIKFKKKGQISKKIRQGTTRVPKNQLQVKFIDHLLSCSASDI